jgi:uncharacterized protein (DUF2384 family)
MTTAGPFRDDDPLQLVQLERSGMPARAVAAMAISLGLSERRVFEVIGLPQSIADRKVQNNEPVTGASGYAAIGIMRLMEQAREIVGRSTSPKAVGFDSDRWLGRWLEMSQPALGGRKPADFLNTPTGFKLVSRVLGALESGAYQ